MLTVIGCPGGCGSVKAQVVCGWSPARVLCLGCMESFSHALVRASAPFLICSYLVSASVTDLECKQLYAIPGLCAGAPLPPGLAMKHLRRPWLEPLGYTWQNTGCDHLCLNSAKRIFLHGVVPMTRCAWCSGAQSRA